MELALRVKGETLECERCGEEFPDSGVGPLRRFCSDFCARNKSNPGLGRVDSFSEYKLALSVLTVCPMCSILGPQRLLGEHLRQDHGVKA